MKNMETRLYELRKKTGMSQDELAEKIGVSRQTISKWERGEALPDTENLIALAKLYNVTMIYFEDFSEDIQFYPNLVALSILTGVESLYDIIMSTLQKDFTTQLVTLEQLQHLNQ